MTNINLLTTAAKLIKKATKKVVMSKIPKIFQTGFNALNKKIKILKFKNYESYLYGDD